MLVFRIAAVAITALLSTPALACQCNTGGTINDVQTVYCCGQLGGTATGGNQCEAASISEHLSNFRSCCGGGSDCDFPKEKRDGFETVVVN
ncbi:Uu.00g060340.m01.CDS01 [Anthostomella pinea]|uniref:Uu.00g060340.m01.CDS01 n=1 Tax=Anthostomella pinea TaxID=933095 RepID=A0AAI8VSX3_9PEZI|nr:Uu.00g060340.m01.CDS01 [Anthostomella pinea]